MWRETVAAVAMSVLAVGAVQAEEGCCGMDLVRVECFPELGTMEIRMNDFLHLDLYYIQDNAEKWAKQNCFTFYNFDKADRFRRTSCRLNGNLYEVKFHSAYWPFRIDYAIYKNGKVLLPENVFYSPTRITDTDMPVTVAELRLNADDDSLDVKYVYVQENSYDVDNDYLTFATIKNAEAYSRFAAAPADWQRDTYFSEDDGKALNVHCLEDLQAVEVRFVNYKSTMAKKALQADAAELMKKGIYVFEANNVPETFEAKCRFEGKEFAVRVDKETQLTVSREGEEVISGIRLYEPERNELITYVRYADRDDFARDTGHDAVWFEWWDKKQNKLLFNRLPGEYWSSEDYKRIKGRVWTVRRMDDFYNMKKSTYFFHWTN